MPRKSLLLASVAAAALATLPTPASACDPVPGALIGGGIGAAIGNAPGAAIGAILGSAITGGAPCHNRYDDRYYDRPYVEGRYYDRGYYEPAPVYYAPPRRMYYEPAPVYYAPRVAYRSYPVYGYAPVYVSYGHRYYRHDWRDSRRHWDRRDWRHR